MLSWDALQIQPWGRRDRARSPALAFLACRAILPDARAAGWRAWNLFRHTGACRPGWEPPRRPRIMRSLSPDRAASRGSQRVCPAEAPGQRRPGPVGNARTGRTCRMAPSHTLPSHLKMTPKPPPVSARRHASGFACQISSVVGKTLWPFRENTGGWRHAPRSF
jgi:hypothetical protein